MKPRKYYKLKKDYLFYNGQTVEADIAYSEIYSYAKKTINIVDNYISLKTLVLLKSVAKGVKVTIFSDNVNHGLHQTEFDDFKKEYPDVDITLKTTGGIYHDLQILRQKGGAGTEDAAGAAVCQGDRQLREPTDTNVPSPERDGYPWCEERYPSDVDQLEAC